MLASTKTPGSSRRRALVISADRVTLRSCRDALESTGFSVDAVESGIAAVIAARASLPALIFVDGQLRDVPGREAIKWLRSIPALKTTPVIVLASEAEDGVATVARSDSALRKPVSLAAIRTTLQELFEPS